jgi:hypothetical protein
VVHRDSLRLIQRTASVGAVDFTEHAREEMENDEFYDEDVINALVNADEALSESGNKWKVYGPSVSGDAMAVITLIVDDNKRLRVITVHLPP